MKKTQIIVIAIVLAFLVSVQNANAATKSRSAISPYFQTDGDGIYSFVGISHPSLSTSTTQVGLTIATVGNTGATPSTSFTITAGETYRIFIVSTNHSTINSLTVTGDRVIFLTTTTGSTAFGSLLLTSSSSNPEVAAAVSAGFQATLFNGLNQLNLWGAIVVPSTSSGFAMEFIGDAHDSLAGPNTGPTAAPINPIAAGRGISN